MIERVDQREPLIEKSLSFRFLGRDRMMHIAQARHEDGGRAGGGRVGVLGEGPGRYQDERNGSESHTQDSTRDSGKTDERHGKLSNPARLSLASLKGGENPVAGNPGGGGNPGRGEPGGGTRDGDLNSRF